MQLELEFGGGHGWREWMLCFWGYWRLGIGGREGCLRRCRVEGLGEREREREGG